jgi:hypothetical protein
VCVCGETLRRCRLFARSHLRLRKPQDAPSNSVETVNHSRISLFGRCNQRAVEGVLAALPARHQIRTYIPMRQGFLYLVAIIDWAIRRVLSWRLSNTLTKPAAGYRPSDYSSPEPVQNNRDCRNCRTDAAGLP